MLVEALALLSALTAGAWLAHRHGRPRAAGASTHEEVGLVEPCDGAPQPSTRGLMLIEREPADHVFVAIAEIDRFQSLRRRLGYTLSNELMGGIAARVRAGIGSCEIGRVNRTSVEFVFCAPDIAQARASLLRLSASLERPIDVGGYNFDLSITIGAADGGAGPVDEQLFDWAAAAVAEAQAQHSKVSVADPTATEVVEFDQLAMMRELRSAMRNGELQLHYQPKLRARTDTIEAAEALLRWHHPEHGLIRTDKLVDMAEETGAIRDLSRWVIDRAMADQAWFAGQGHDITVFVNISGVLLSDHNFAQWASERMAGAGGRIGFEVTETAVIRDPDEAIAHLNAFADLGVKIAIDDYGSGLSSLAYLKQLPAHELKIDRMFVSGLAESHRDPLLVRSSIDLAHALEMEVTAEGVDDPLALSLLRVMGCDMIQGYLIAHPLAREELAAFLNEEGYRERVQAPSFDPSWGALKVF